jgi:hypothetical protein
MGRLGPGAVKFAWHRWDCGNLSSFLLRSKLREGQNGVNAMIQIQLQPEIEAQLAAEAQARGVALDRYIEKIVSARSVEPLRHRTVGEAIDAIRELRKGNNLNGLAIDDLIHQGHKY